MTPVNRMNPELRDLVTHEPEQMKHWGGGNGICVWKLKTGTLVIVFHYSFGSFGRLTLFSFFHSPTSLLIFSPQNAGFLTSSIDSLINREGGGGGNEVTPASEMRVSLKCCCGFNWEVQVSPSGHVPEDPPPTRPTCGGADGICYGLGSLVAPQLFRSLVAPKGPHHLQEAGAESESRSGFVSSSDFPAPLRVFQLQLLRTLTDFHQTAENPAEPSRSFK